MVEYSMVMPSLATYIDEVGGTHILYGVAVGTLKVVRIIQSQENLNNNNHEQVFSPFQDFSRCRC